MKTELIASLQRLIDHPNTPDHERDAAIRAMERVRARAAQQPGSRFEYHYKYEGEKYRKTSNLTIDEIAKIIREDIKVMLKAGLRSGVHGAELAIIDPIAALPKRVRITVRRTWSGWTPSLTITVWGLEGPRWWRLAHGFVHANGSGSRANVAQWYAHDALLQVGDALYGLANAYNYDDSDSMTDYFNCRFYLHVQAARPGKSYPVDIDRRRDYYEGVTEWIDEQPVPEAA